MCFLIPKLCFLSGISESTRPDFRVRKNQSHLKVFPIARQEIIRNIILQVQTDENMRSIDKHEWRASHRDRKGTIRSTEKADSNAVYSVGLKDLIEDRQVNDMIGLINIHSTS